MASLFVIQGRDQGKRFELPDEVVSLGRDRGNRIQLRDSEVSRRHAEIRRENDAYQLVDLDSSNGTFVNSQRVERRRLRSGDRVQVGRTVLLFTEQSGQPSQPPAHVDIVGQADPASPSHIVSTLESTLGGEALAAPPDDRSQWLARAQSNLQIMYRTALAVSHTLDIDQLLQRILELIFEWVEADRGCIMLLDRETDQLRPAARHDRRGVPAEEKMTISRTILDYVLQRREGVLTSDARRDQRWDAEGSILRLGVREAICVPMQGRYGVVGAIYIDTYTPPGRSLPGQPPRFTDEHLKLMVAIGHQAALAIEDTSFYSALVQAERLAAIGQTIATLSHHIKNILQGVRGGSYLIEEGLYADDTEMIRKGWAIVERNQHRISDLVMDMLTWSKERAPERVTAQLNDVAAEVVDLLRPRAAEAGVRLSWRADPNLPPFPFDPEGLHRAVTNVVVNALEACEGRPNGQVDVASRFLQDTQTAQIVVRDTGQGVAPEDQERIFNVFVSTKGNRGTGLGLAVTRKILQEHQGRVRLESRPGQGSTFLLELPAAAVQDRGTSTPE